MRNNTEERTRAQEEVERWWRTVGSPSSWMLIDARDAAVLQRAREREETDGRE